MIFETPNIMPLPPIRLRKSGALLSPVINGAYTTFSWSDGDFNLTRLIGNPGVYTLVVANNFCSDSSEFIILPPFSIYAPTAFRPSGIFNPNFKIYTNGEINISTFDIFDRWGNFLVTCDNDKGWDGTVRGKQVQPGVFIFQAKGSTKEGETELLSGEINLID
jgi:gliding motility-associated-like protein